MKLQSGWIRRLAEQTDLQAEAFPCQPLVELFGCDRLLIEHYKCIVCYSPELISVRMGYGLMHINGHGLELARMTDRQLVISGRLDGLCIVRGDLT